MMGGVPRVVVLDNATEAGRCWHDVITESKLFRRFRLHYGFEARFCNPNSGNENGNVENKVGFIRRNYMVPAPKVGDLRDYNEALNTALEDRSRREAHYEKGLTVFGNRKSTLGTAVVILDRIHPTPLAGPSPCGTAWGSCNPGRFLS